jgi:hypothetical protein
VGWGGILFGWEGVGLVGRVFEWVVVEGSVDVDSVLMDWGLMILCAGGRIG